ncbi:MAG: SDR family oxidoreductase [Magnetococcales bacterium]|nr:SDR family oxidoreductase [Magnetococcales bacterium]
MHGTAGLVTGAGQRIGQACALALAEAGVGVAVHFGRSREAADAVCRQIRDRGGRALVLQADLADPGQCASLIPRAAAVLGPLAILVNCAAIFEPGSLARTTPEAWNRHLAINLTAPFLLIQALAAQCPAPPTRQDEPAAPVAGKVVNVIDQRIHRPRPGHLAYTTAKSALWTLTRIAAAELAPRIQVNAIGPGPILPAPDATPEAFLRVAAATPMGRPGRVADLVHTLRFFLENDYVTGEMVCVDGGEHL